MNRMNDTISRQAAIAEITEYGSEDNIYISVKELKRRIEQLPSIPSEIIRCKDCKHRPILDEDEELHFPTYKCPCQCEDYYYSWMPKDNWFCGNGERRENETD